MAVAGDRLVMAVGLASREAAKGRHAAQILIEHCLGTAANASANPVFDLVEPVVEKPGSAVKDVVFLIFFPPDAVVVPARRRRPRAGESTNVRSLHIRRHSGHTVQPLFLAGAKWRPARPRTIRVFGATR